MTHIKTERTGNRDRILEIVSNGVTRLMVEDDPDAEISVLLSDLGQAMDVCRVYIFEHHFDRKGIPVVSQRYEWTRDGVSAEINNEQLQNLPCDDPCSGPMLSTLQTGDVVQGDVKNFIEATRTVLEAQGILSILLVPIFIRSNWRGFIGFDACRFTREWESDDVEALRIAAGLVGASLYSQQTQTQLKKSETRFRALLDNTPGVAVQGYGADGLIHYWNNACETIYGYTAEEAIGQNLVDLVIPLEMRGYVREAIREGAETGNMPPPGEHDLLRKGGGTVPVLSSHACVSIPGHPAEMFCIDVDLSPIKQAQQELAESREQLRRLRQHAEHIRDDEQKQIARRIHDDFGQRLTTLTMDLTRLRDKICTPDDENFSRLNSDLKIIEELLALARDISMELRPSVLDHFGLSAALEWAAENLESSSSISAELDLDEDLHLEQDTQSSLYRIAQELLTNIVRHADASNILISLKCVDNIVHLTITDDGAGMQITALTDMKTMGLLGVRETALALGGQVDINSVPGHGTTVQVNVPASQTKGSST